MTFKKGNTVWLGRKHREETKLKMSLAKLGVKRKEFTERAKENMGKVKTGAQNSMFGKSHTEETKKKMSENHADVGGEKNPMFGVSRFGEANPCWQGGITPINKIIRGSAEYEEWRKKVFEQDNHTCRKCGKRGNTYLHAHHIKPFSEHPELRFDTENGITLCRECHELTHTCRIKEDLL